MKEVWLLEQLGEGGASFPHLIYESKEALLASFGEGNITLNDTDVLEFDVFDTKFYASPWPVHGMPE